MANHEISANIVVNASALAGQATPEAQAPQWTYHFDGYNINPFGNIEVKKVSFTKEEDENSD